MRIILHVGAGKTGTTSIQNSLSRSHSLLEANHILYAGYMLENLKSHRFPWQDKSGLKYFHSMSESNFVKEASIVLNDTISSQENSRYDTLIWSNEALFDRPSLIKKLVDELGLGHSYVVVAYVRRHDKWLESAYKQFSIYGKTYEGNIRPFNEWAKINKIGFSKSLDALANIESIRLTVRNVDAVKDVVSDFYSILNLSVNSKQTDNTSISPEKMVLRALFANEYFEKVGGNYYNDFMGRIISCEETPQSFLDKLLPDREALLEASEKLRNDIDKTNIHLKNSNQQQISIVDVVSKKNLVDESKLLFALIEIVFIQGKKISSLEQKISELLYENE